MKRNSILLASAAALAGGLFATALLPGSLPASVASPARAASAERIDAADALFDADRMGETRALLVVKDGRIVVELYGPGYGPDSRLISWSMAKTVTAVLVGLMVSDGRLALDAPAPVPAWQRAGDPRGEITLRQLLHMSSGLEHVENGDPVYDSDTVRMLFLGGAGDMARYAEAKPLADPPGRRFVYSTATSVILADILARALTLSDNPATRRDALLGYLHGRLAGPLGMTSLTPEFDAAGTMVGGSIMHATARDYARFGEFLRNDGMANGQRILPHGWVAFMRTPAPTDGGYGGHLWLNRPRPAGRDAALWPGQGPADLFACIGHQGQYIIVSPSQRLTVVRLGISTRDQMDAVRDGLRRLVAAS